MRKAVVFLFTLLTGVFVHATTQKSLWTPVGLFGERVNPATGEIEPDDNRHALDGRTLPGSAIVRIEYDDPRVDRLCTGVLVNACTVVTAKHCLSSWPMRLYAKGGQVEASVLKGSILAGTGSEEGSDYAVFQANRPLGTWAGWIEPEFHTGAELVQQKVSLLSYSWFYDRKAYLTVEPTGFIHAYDALRGSILVEVDSAVGSSGAPFVLMSRGRLVVVGIQTQSDLVENSANDREMIWNHSYSNVNAARGLPSERFWKDLQATINRPCPH